MSSPNYDPTNYSSRDRAEYLIGAAHRLPYATGQDIIEDISISSAMAGQRLSATDGYVFTIMPSNATTHTHVATNGTKLRQEFGIDFQMDKMAETADAKVMTAAERTKLAGIAAGAQVNTVTSVAGRTGAVAIAAADITDAATKLVGTDAQTLTAAQKTAAATNIGTISAAGAQSFTTAEKTQLKANIGLPHNITISASAPSGGSDGDIWFQY
jgi:hypothetical protein